MNKKIEWRRSLERVLVLTVRERENHKRGSGKYGATIEKTLERGCQFKNKRYLHADTKDLFKFKGVFQAIMKKE